MTLAVVLRFWLPLCVLIVLAFRAGELPERIGASLLGIAGAATLALHAILTAAGASDLTFTTARTTVDVALFVALIDLSLRANRLWPIALTACHGVTVLSHLAAWGSLFSWRLGYSLLRTAPAYLTLVTLAIGVANNWRLRRQGVVRRSWRRSSAARGWETTLA